MSDRRRDRASAPLRAATALAAMAFAAVAGSPAPARAASLLDVAPRVYSLKLDDTSKLSLLRSYFAAGEEHTGPVVTYLGGRWGAWDRSAWWTLSWGADRDDTTSEEPPLDEPLARDVIPLPEDPDVDPDVEALRVVPGGPPTWLHRLAPDWAAPFLASTGPSFASNGFDVLWEPAPKPVPWWKRCRRRPVTFVRYGAEQDTFALVRCDGVVAPFALDRLSILARPPDVPRPGDLLPDEPDPEAWKHGEWLPRVHLMHARLLWALQKIADAFPRRTIYIFSGYRPPKGKLIPGTHHSMHAEGRATDIHVMGVSNADLFRFCRKLPDVGCGFYPNSKFVHVDVRRPGTGHAYWVDVSSPGEPSRYVDSWPGVVERGALVWNSRGVEPESGQARPSKTGEACAPRP